MTIENVSGDVGNQGGGAVYYEVIADGNGLLVDGSAGVAQLFAYSVTGSGGILFDGTASVASLFSYTEIGSGGFNLDGIAIINNNYNYSETGTGGIVLNQAPFSNGYFYRVLVTIPAWAVSQDIDKFYLGIRADLPPAELTSTVAITTFAGTSLPCELRKVDSGTVWVFFSAPLKSATANKFYLYYGQ